MNAMEIVAVVVMLDTIMVITHVLYVQLPVLNVNLLINVQLVKMVTINTMDFATVVNIYVHLVVDRVICAHLAKMDSFYRMVGVFH